MPGAGSASRAKERTRGRQREGEREREYATFKDISRRNETFLQEEKEQDGCCQEQAQLPEQEKGQEVDREREKERESMLPSKITPGEKRHFCRRKRSSIAVARSRLSFP